MGFDDIKERIQALKHSSNRELKNQAIEASGSQRQPAVVEFLNSPRPSFILARDFWLETYSCVIP
jgi:hypothetical protein